MSGDALIDGLISHYAWSGSALTYAFPSRPGDYNYSGEPDKGFRSVSNEQKAAARFVLDANDGNAANDGFSVEGLTDLDVSVGTQDKADIKIAESSAANPTAYGYLPSTTQKGGDVWFGTSYNYRSPEPGNYSFLTMLHELGHALGLKHGHNASDGWRALPDKYDSLEFSVMTYRTYVNSGTKAYSFEKNGAPQTYMMADIAALQYLYGADFSTNSSDTVYSWSPGNGKTEVNGVVAIAPAANRIFATIWDGGGIDTYDLGAYSSNLKIDLAPGGHCVFRGVQLADLGGGPNNGHARGNIFNARLYEGDQRSLIENAIGGKGNDKLMGNVGDNQLEGGNGVDRLFGRGGNDVLVGGAGRDHFVFAKNHDADSIDDFEDGLDLIHLNSFALGSEALALGLATEVAGDVVFDFGGGDTLTIRNISLASITEADIVLG
jgi:serralysin